MARQERAVCAGIGKTESELGETSSDGYFPGDGERNRAMYHAPARSPHGYVLIRLRIRIPDDCHKIASERRSPIQTDCALFFARCEPPDYKEPPGIRRKDHGDSSSSNNSNFDDRATGD
jgi:hypothetical protein